MTLAAQTGTLPLSVAGFGQISIVAPLANAVLLPLLGPIMVLGLPVAAAGALAPALGYLLGLVVYPFLALMIGGVTLLARLPLAASPAAPWPLAAVAAYYIAVAAVMTRVSTTSTSGHGGAGTAYALPEWLPGAATLHRAASWAKARTAMRQMRAPVQVPVPLWAAGGVALLLGATVAGQAPPHGYLLSVMPLGTGQGLLLTTPSGTTTLVDGGDAPSRLDAALGTRLPFWRARLDLVVLTATDRAHAGGLRDLTTRYGIGRALDPGAVYPASDYTAWRAALRDAGVPEAKLRSHVRVPLDRNAALDVLLPAGLDPDLPDTACVLRLDVAGLTVLLPNRAALDVLDNDPTIARGAVSPTALTGGGAHRGRDAAQGIGPLPGLSVPGHVGSGTAQSVPAVVLILPAGPSDPGVYTHLIAAVHPRLVVLPSPAEVHDSPPADLAAARTAHALGARVWQSDGTGTGGLDFGPWEAGADPLPHGQR